MKPEGEGGGMQRKDSIFLICLLGTYTIMLPVEEVEFREYENQITAIDQLDTVSGQKIIVHFSHTNPICAYAPKNYEESLDDTISRNYLPKTTISDGVEIANNDDVLVDSDEEGVEIVVRGKSIQKIVGEQRVFFIVKQ